MIPLCALATMALVINHCYTSFLDSIGVFFHKNAIVILHGGLLRIAIFLLDRCCFCGQMPMFEVLHIGLFLILIPSSLMVTILQSISQFDQF